MLGTSLLCCSLLLCAVPRREPKHKAKCRAWVAGWALRCAEALGLSSCSGVGMWQWEVAVGTVGWGRLQWGSKRSFVALVLLRLCGPALSQQSQCCGQRDAECRALPLLLALTDGPWDTQSARPAAPWCGVQCGAGAGGLLRELEVTVRDLKFDWSSDINVSVRGLCTTPRGFTLRLG